MSVWACTTYQKLGRIVLFQRRKFDLFTRYYSHSHECGLSSTYARNFVKLSKFPFKDINLQVINCVKNITVEVKIEASTTLTSSTFMSTIKSKYYISHPHHFSSLSLPPIPHLLFLNTMSHINSHTPFINKTHILTHTNLSVSVVIYIP